MTSDRKQMDGHRHDEGEDPGMQTRMYLRFGAMILTSMVVMFIASWEWSHIRFSQSRVFMTLAMGGTMGLVMLAWMLHMYRSTRANVVVVLVSLLLLGLGATLDRSQATGAVEISEAQRREILEMDWLIDDIAENGVAATPEEADARAVPDFTRPAARACPQG